jgi:site-specific DNA-methyltransferase (adenine-specific)
MVKQIYLGENLSILKMLPSESVNLIYIDPPFNTGKEQARRSIRVKRDESGDRVGFGGQSYSTELLNERAYQDSFVDFLSFIRPRLLEAHRLLKAKGSLYFHIDYREAHYCKILLDEIFGRANFINEIIWAYDFGGRPKNRWPAKHDTIFFYAKDANNYTFNRDDIDRIPYMAPGLVGKEKAEKGKLPTDVWWHTIVGTNSKEKTGYPTQKPFGVIERIVRASSNPGDLVMDFFAGSGTVGAVCEKLDRNYILIDQNPEAWDVMKTRFADVKDIEWIN